MTSRKPPPFAAWRHVSARDGFEIAFPYARDGGYRFHGCTTAIESGQAWIVEYVIDLDAGWRTRQARVRGRTSSGVAELVLEADGEAHWRVNGVTAPHLDGCFDVDLESSALTNAFPVQRLALAVGAAADAPAAYVRAFGLGVERLEQRYVRVANDGTHARYDYAAPAFGFESLLVYDEFGLVLDYPGIAARVA